MAKKRNTYSFIDLFAGCGGLTEGFYRQNFTALAHVEIDKAACETLRQRMIYYGYKNPDKEVLLHDITAPDIIDTLSKAVDNREVDIIIGGPPCQAYSSAGRARDEHGMQNDPRNFLFESYVSILNHFRPKMFVFENVSGILTAKVKGKSIIKQVFAALGEHYNVIDNAATLLLNSADYGVPQVRNRVIIIGVRKDINIDIQDVYASIKKTHYNPETPESERKGLKKYVTVADAISELPAVAPGGGLSEQKFSYSHSNDFLKAIASKDDILRDHVCRKHNDMDRERYRTMAREHWTFEQLLENRADLRHEVPRVFGNSYVVQWWDLPSRTIIAHLYKDGNQFIHPDDTQARTLTVREAARLQSFPDDFVFAGSRTDKFKQIGNAVPCLFAEAIAKAVKQTLKRIDNDI
jgi:DNA (cytosine-5)-methyltransferase 1